MNEDKLLNFLISIPEMESCGIIKTKQYVDMDCLEKAMFAGTVSTEIIDKIDECIERKEIVTLRVTKCKGDK